MFPHSTCDTKNGKTPARSEVVTGHLKYVKAVYGSIDWTDLATARTNTHVEVDVGARVPPAHTTTHRLGTHEYTRGGRCGGKGSPHIQQHTA